MDPGPIRGKEDRPRGARRNDGRREFFIASSLNKHKPMTWQLLRAEPRTSEEKHASWSPSCLPPSWRVSGRREPL